MENRTANLDPVFPSPVDVRGMTRIPTSVSLNSAHPTRHELSASDRPRSKFTLFGNCIGPVEKPQEVFRDTIPSTGSYSTNHRYRGKDRVSSSLFSCCFPFRTTCWSNKDDSLASMQRSSSIDLASVRSHGSYSQSRTVVTSVDDLKKRGRRQSRSASLELPLRSNSTHGGAQHDPMRQVQSFEMYRPRGRRASLETTTASVKQEDESGFLDRAFENAATIRFSHYESAEQCRHIVSE